MSGYVPTPADGWPEIAEVLTGTGDPWPVPAAVTDLRWWVDRCGRRLWARGDETPSPAELAAGIPGRPTLRARWGWTDHRVRVLLSNTSVWWDSHRWGDAPSPADRQPVASRSPADRQPHQGQRQTTKHESPAGRQPVASRSPADLHTRVGSPSPSPSPSPATSGQMVVNGRKPPPPNEPDEVVVCELLALQRVEGREVPQHRVSDRTALETSLRNGRSSDWHRGYIELALESGIRMCTWAMLLGEKLTSLRHRYEADIEALQRQKRQYAHEPHPDPATIKIHPPPTRRPRER